MKKLVILLVLTIVFVSCDTNTEEIHFVSGKVIQAKFVEYKPGIKVMQIVWDKKLTSETLFVNSGYGLYYTGQVWHFSNFNLPTDSIINKFLKMTYMNIDPKNGLFLAGIIEVHQEPLSK